MDRKLVLGFGNVDRQDDGVAWYVMLGAFKRLSLPIPSAPEEEFLWIRGNPRFIFLPQLVPEIAETVAEYDRICFIDAHTGNNPSEIHFSEIRSEYQSSPFTHHLTPETCLYLAETIFHGTPSGSILSIRGYQFNFKRQLSSRTTRSAKQAVNKLSKWLSE